MYKILIVSFIIGFTSFTLNAQEEGSKSRNKNSKLERGKDSNIQNVEAFFNRMDRNGDGVLSNDELPKRMKSRLKNVDTDKNGQISKKEFATAAANRRKAGRGAGKKGGRKSGSAMRIGSQQLQKKMKEQMQDPDAWLKRFDKNGDQVISKDELPAKLGQKFAKMDKNGNDQLEKNEIVAIIEIRKAEGGMKSKRYDTDSSKTKPQLPKRPPRN